MKKIIVIIAYFLYFYPVKSFLRVIGYDRSIYLAERVSVILKVFARKKIKRMRKNCKIFFGDTINYRDIEQIIKKFLKNSAKLNVNRLFFDRISREKCSVISKFYGMENLHEALSFNKGAIITFCHNGSHTLALHCLGALSDQVPHLYTFHDITSTSSRLNAFFTKKMVSHHMVGFAKTHQKGLRDFYRSLKSNNIAAIAFDGVRGNKFINVPFGKYRLKMSEGTFKLSLRTGAPIIPFFSSYDNGTGIRVYIGKPIIADNIQKAADTFIKEFETFILKYPQDWSGWIRLDMENDKEGAYFRLLKDKLLW